MSRHEYAKCITSYVPGTIYGLRTVVTLPSETWVGWKVKTNGNGFIDAYLSLDRGTGTNTLHYECGLSQAAGHANHYGLYDNTGDGKWHWMYAAGKEGADGGLYNLSPGQQIPIELSINSDNTMSFIVNYNVVKIFKASTNAITNARLVIGACDQDYLAESSVPASPLTAWGTFHNQIACTNYAYQTQKGGAWTLSNTTTNGFNRVYWPTQSTHNTNPNAFIVATGNGSLTASLKKPL
jgi:hypothetical protein